MREIKFDVMVQIKHPEVGEVAFEHNPISEYLHDGFIFFKNGILSTDQEDDDHKTIIREYTGLKDSFDHEVYEGDIVTYGTEDGIVTALVEFAEEDSEESMFITGFQMKVIIVTDYEDGDDSDHAFEVCGNIYENPELLVSK